MTLRFRLKGLAETFVEEARCPSCGAVGEESGANGCFDTSYTKVTYDGIIVVLECQQCHQIFLPDRQKVGIINPQKLRGAVDKDSQNTGMPVVPNRHAVSIDVERLNAYRNNKVH